jgi:hypothetical protein
MQDVGMPPLNGVGATSACLREAASAKAGRPKGPASRDPTQRPRISEGLQDVTLH